MSLTERWRGLATLPRVPLANLPTPMLRLDRASAAAGVDLWCKRDDLTAREYGGNKVRKLEWLLGEAQARGADCIVTPGALGSHHVLATATFARTVDLDVHAVLVPQPWNRHVEENLRADLALGATLYPARGYLSAGLRMWAVARQLRRAGRTPYLVGAGGSSRVGAVGYVEAGVEIAAQVEAGQCPAPAAVYVAAGSAGTMVGLAIGLCAAGLETNVVGVRVTDRIAINRPMLSLLTRRTVALLRRQDPAFPEVAGQAMSRLRIDASQEQAGYGYPTAEARAATALLAEDGIALDPTYTSKAAAGLLARARAGAGPLLYVHTLSAADLAPVLARAPGVPTWCQTLVLKEAARESGGGGLAGR